MCIFNKFVVGRSKEREQIGKKVTKLNVDTFTCFAQHENGLL